MSNEVEYADTPWTIASLFNRLFTSISFNSTAECYRCKNFVVDRFNLLKENNFKAKTVENLNFKEVILAEVKVAKLTRNK